MNRNLTEIIQKRFQYNMNKKRTNWFWINNWGEKNIKNLIEKNWKIFEAEKITIT